MAQSNILDKTITVQATVTTLSTVLAQLQGQLEGYSFSYNPNTLPLRARLTYNASHVSLEEVLEFLATNLQIDYTVIERQIILNIKADEPLLYNVSGVVVDGKTGETLVGATVYLEAEGRGTITNGYGRFNLILPYGKNQITTSYLGYEIGEDSVDLVADLTLSISMKESSSQLKEIVVKSKAQYFIEEIQTGKVSITPSAVKELPTAFGEFDVIKSLETVPGITLQTDGSTFFSVRGGNKDHNLVLIDDAPIYNPTHLLGLYSSIVPDAINSIDVYRSDFPITKGGRISSVIDIKTKEGNKYRFSGWGNIGLVSTQLGLEGPFKKGKHSYILSGRLSRIKWLFKQENPGVEKFQFHDITGKTNFQLNKNNRLYLSFYSGSDQFLDQQSGLGWTNLNGSVRWNRVLEKNSLLNLTLYGSNYEYLFHYDRINNVSWRSRIGEFGLKADFNSFLKNNQELTYGFSLVGRTMNPGNLVTENTVPEDLIVSVKNNFEVVGYIEHKVNLSKKLGLKYGLRSIIWSNIGESFEYAFNDQGQAVDTAFYQPGEIYQVDLQLEPRLTLNYFINKNSSLKGSYGRSVQNLHLISNTISPFTSFEVWLPSGPNINPQLANQLSLAYYYAFNQIGLELRLEGYYKAMKNQIDFTNHASTLLNPAIESELLFGDVKSYGFEVQAKKDDGRLRGSVSYSYSKARSQFNQINNGQTYNSMYDKPHQANLSLIYDIGERVMLGSNFIYTSGLPFSSPTSFYYFDDNEIPVYASKNNSRFPNYHRLDLNAKFILNKDLNKRFRHSITLSIFNLYSRRNPIFINFNKSVENGQFFVPTNLLDATRISSHTYIYRFTPAINYQFRF